RGGRRELRRRLRARHLPSHPRLATRPRRGASRAPSGRALPLRGALARVLLGHAGREPPPPPLHGPPVEYDVRLPDLPADARRARAPRDGAPLAPASGMAPGRRRSRLSARPVWLAHAVRAPMDARTIGRVIGRLRAATPGWNVTALAAVADATARDPFRILIGCLLSLRTRDETTGPAAAPPFALP